jgi:hypothetical protein
MAAAAIGGAVGSIAGQAVGIATGVQDEFSWKSVGLAALGAAVTAGIGGLSGGAEAVAAKSGSFLGISQAKDPLLFAAARGVTNSLVMQGLGSALGLQSFSWKAIAVSAITAPINTGINAALGDAMSGLHDVARDGVLGTLNGALAQAVRMQVYNDGKVDWSSIAADAFGNAIGNGIVATARDSALPDEVRAMGFADRERAHRLARTTNMDLQDPLQARELVDVMQMTSAGKDLGQARREELTLNALRRQGLSSDQIGEAQRYFEEAGLFRGSDSAADATVPESSSAILSSAAHLILPRVEIVGQRAHGTVLGAEELDAMAIGIGSLTRRVSAEVQTRPWLEALITGAQFVAAPVMFTVNKIIEASPVGQAIEHTLGELHEDISERFAAAKYGLPDAVDGGSGVMTLAALGTGFSATQAIAILGVASRKSTSSILANIVAKQRAVAYQNKLAATLGERYLVRAGEEWHHTIPRKEPWAADLREKLADLGIDINDPRNAVFLPRNAAAENPFGKVLHSETQGALGREYGQYLKDQFSTVSSRSAAFAALERVRGDLLSGIKPWMK